jgi:nucleotide-binding universal stress UspA family protein
VHQSVIDIDVDAADDLIQVARDHAADLVVIGVRRRTPTGKLILGSQAQRILLDAPCAVLAVKPE